MKKSIWIINHYAGNMFFDKGGRHYWFSKYLKREGYNPVVFVANTKHGVKEQWIPNNLLWNEQVDKEIEVPFIFVKTSSYSGNGKDRIKNMLLFYKNVKKAAVEYAEKNGIPDIIYASSVHPLTLLAGIQLARKFGVKCVCEVRDLWPEAILAYSKRVAQHNILVKILYAGEKWLYKKADAVIFTQEGGPNYVCEHGWDKAHGGPIDVNKLFHINNGVDIEAFDYNLMNYPYVDKDLDNPNIYKVVYAGSIRRINNVGILLDAARLIKNKKIKLIIFGSGDELDKLNERIKRDNIENVVFKGRVNKKYIPSIVSKADLNIVHWEMNELLRVGESYNKSFEYFAAGRPVFYTIRPGYSIVNKFQCGALTNGFEAKDIASGIEYMINMGEDKKKKMQINARTAAEAYDFKVLTKKLIDIIENC